MVELSVPAIYKETYLVEIEKMNQKNAHNIQVSEVYGSVQGAPAGTIRPQETLPQITLKDLKEYVESANKKGIKFNYIWCIELQGHYAKLTLP